MERANVIRLGLILAIQAEIEGMKAGNSQYKYNQPYSEKDFFVKAEELKNIVYKPDELL